MSTQTEAQRLADKLKSRQILTGDHGSPLDEAAAELLRLEAANAELLKALRYIHGLSLTKDYRDLHAIFGRMNAAIEKHGGKA